MQQHNISILSTRPIDSSLIYEAKKLKIDIDVKSFIETATIDDTELIKEVQKIARGKATIIFTSMNAVENVAAMVEKQNPEWKIYCIGNTTRELVNEYFKKGTIAGFANSAAELGAIILDEKDLRDAIFFCGDQRRKELPAILSGRGIQVKEIIVYKTTPILHKVEKEYQGILFFSPSAVDSFFLNNQTDEHCTLFAIGSTTASAIKKYTNNKIIVSENPGKNNLVKLMQDFFNKQPEVPGR